MHPVKLYNSNSVLIYQVDSGAGNGGKLPSGGVLASSAAAGSMSEVVANPITIYGTYVTEVINIIGQSGDLYNYYWTSYSRGMDGRYIPNQVSWHNLYLDSYIPLRHKSIYDPCPYGYRIPSNGTYNQFTPNKGWIQWSYVGGVTWDQSWIAALGAKNPGFYTTASHLFIYVSTCVSSSYRYYFLIDHSISDIRYNGDNHTSQTAMSLRCIEECEILLARIVSKIDVTAHGAV